jgi:hypothetical protein
LFADSLTVKKQGKQLYNSNIEKWHYYTAGGRNYLTIDYANLTRMLHDTLFQFQEYQDEIREKADSIVCSYYSREFFDKHIKLNANRSRWVLSSPRKHQEGLWFELFDSRPRYFEMAYLVMISPTMGFAYIQFKLNDEGELIEPHASSGLHPVKCCCFQIDVIRIKEIIKASQLENPDDPGSEWALEWNEEKQDLRVRITYGRFVTIGDDPGFNSRTIYINPWDGTWQPLASFEWHLW